MSLNLVRRLLEKVRREIPKRLFIRLHRYFNVKNKVASVFHVNNDRVNTTRRISMLLNNNLILTIFRRARNIRGRINTLIESGVTGILITILANSRRHTIAKVVQYRPTLFINRLLRRLIRRVTLRRQFLHHRHLMNLLPLYQINNVRKVTRLFRHGNGKIANVIGRVGLTLMLLVP